MHLQLNRKLLRGSLMMAALLLWLHTIWLPGQPVSAASPHSPSTSFTAENDSPPAVAALPLQENTPTPSPSITDTVPLTSTETLTDSAPQADEPSDEPVEGEADEEGASDDAQADGETDGTTEDTTDDATDDATEDGSADESDENASGSLDESQLDTLYSETLEGTIIANRTTASVSFFVEGQLYRLAPLRSLGIDLPRSNSVLNLFSCDADASQSDESCFWDPFLINADGFYEVFNDSPEGETLRLVLEAAGTPPTDQVWIQNRTGEREVLVYNGETYELAPSAVVEFDVADSPIVTFYRRSCLVLNGSSVCEWAPQSVEPGFYYALDELVSEGGPPNSEIVQVDIEPVLSQGDAPAAAQSEAGSEGSAQSASDGSADAATAGDGPAAATQPTGDNIVCQLQVPVLNIRSGPGLEYLVVSQVNADFGVVGQDLTGQWLAVSSDIFDGGWVIAGADFALCNGEVSALPIAEVTDGRLEPTPEPVAEVDPAPADGDAAASDGQSSGDEAGDEAGENGESAEGDDLDAPAVEIPTGQSLLIVTNAFEQDMRFTLSPDEYDLLPGETIYVVVNPGRVQFSVSTPWGGGISGNAEFLIEPDESQTLYLYFVQNPNDRDDWDLYYQ